MNLTNLSSILRKIPTLDNTIWLLGCSYIWGHYLDEENSVPYILQDLVNYPVDNLGILGGSPDLLCDMTVYYLKHHTPKAIIIAWPDTSRTYSISSVGNIETLGSWVLDRSYKSDIDPSTLARYSEELKDNIVVSRNIERIERMPQVITQCPYLSFEYNMSTMFVDKASDGMHPGIMSARNIANSMANWVKTIL